MYLHNMSSSRRSGYTLGDVSPSQAAVPHGPRRIQRIIWQTIIRPLQTIVAIRGCVSATSGEHALLIHDCVAILPPSLPPGWSANAVSAPMRSLPSSVSQRMLRETDDWQRGHTSTGLMVAHTWLVSTLERAGIFSSCSPFVRASPSCSRGRNAKPPP
jgi:hypothetical protein